MIPTDLKFNAVVLQFALYHLSAVLCIDIQVADWSNTAAVSTIHWNECCHVSVQFHYTKVGLIL